MLQSRIAEQGWENDKIIIGQYYDSDNINNPAEIAEDVYMETNFSRENVESLISYLLKEYSINEDMFKFIYYKDR